MSEELRLETETTAVLVIDMQNDFLRDGAPLEVEMGKRCLPDMDAFLDRSRTNDVPIVFTRQVDSAQNLGGRDESHAVVGGEPFCREGTAGAGIHEDVRPIERDVTITKPRYDAFWGTPLDNILRNAGVSTVVVTGLTSTGCCLDTARGAAEREYDVVFLHDLTGTYEYEDFGFGRFSAQELHAVACTIVEQTTGTVAASGEITYC